MEKQCRILKNSPARKTKGSKLKTTSENTSNPAF